MLGSRALVAVVFAVSVAGCASKPTYVGAWRGKWVRSCDGGTGEMRLRIVEGGAVEGTSRVADGEVFPLGGTADDRGVFRIGIVYPRGSRQSADKLDGKGVLQRDGGLSLAADNATMHADGTLEACTETITLYPDARYEPLASTYVPPAAPSAPPPAASARGGRVDPQDGEPATLPCPTCNGNGSITTYATQTSACPSCNGRGSTLEMGTYPDTEYHPRPCWRCGGSGTITETRPTTNVCASCGGIGWVSMSHLNRLGGYGQTK